MCWQPNCRHKLSSRVDLRRPDRHRPRPGDHAARRMGEQITLIGAPDPMSIEAALAVQIGGSTSARPEHLCHSAPRSSRQRDSGGWRACQGAWSGRGVPWWRRSTLARSGNGGAGEDLAFVVMAVASLIGKTHLAGMTPPRSCTVPLRIGDPPAPRRCRLGRTVLARRASRRLQGRRQGRAGTLVLRFLPRTAAVPGPG